MTLELEGNLSLERAHTRRWVSIIAVIIPVAAFVLLAAWFVRAYVVPPTVAIPSPVTLADAPPPPPAIPRRAQVEAPPPSLTASAEPAKETPVSAAALPMIATLAAAPPSMARAPPASAEPADSPSATASITVAEPTAEQQLSEPLAGPIPLPRVEAARSARGHQRRGCGAVAAAAADRSCARARPSGARPPRRQLRRRYSIASPVAIRTGAKPSALNAARISSACAASRVSTVTSSRAPLAGTSRNSRR